MAEKKDDKKKEAPKSSIWSDYSTIWVILGVSIFISLFITNWNGVFFEVENERGGQRLSFPTGDIRIGDEVINKEVAPVRNEPGGGILGRQDRYEKSVVREGPVVLYGERWWRLTFEEAPSGWVSEDSLTTYSTLYFILNIIPIAWQYVKVALWIIIVILIAMIVFVKARLEAAREETKKKLKGTKEPEAVPHIVIGKEEINLPVGEETTPQKERESNTRWIHVLELLQSYSQSDWRQAIIEADIILEEMLDKMGYDGVSIGDKLKNVEPSDFLTLNQAWEAHKVRNKIAHLGSDFKITQDEARRVIGLYQEVFEEFYFI